MHDLEADGAHTVTFVGLRLKVFRMFLLNMPCFMLWKELFFAILADPIHLWGVVTLKLYTKNHSKKIKFIKTLEEDYIEVIC
jgi:hypothetical protein